MNARPGRPPLRATGTSTLSLRIPADIKNYLIDTSEALDMTITVSGNSGQARLWRNLSECLENHNGLPVIWLISRSGYPAG